MGCFFRYNCKCFGHCLFVSQELLWKEQDHKIFFSYHAIHSTDPMFRELTCGTKGSTMDKPIGFQLIFLL
jgi:hypothetical protein